MPSAASPALLSPRSCSSPSSQRHRRRQQQRVPHGTDQPHNPRRDRHFCCCCLFARIEGTAPLNYEHVTFSLSVFIFRQGRPPAAPAGASIAAVPRWCRRCPMPREGGGRPSIFVCSQGTNDRTSMCDKFTNADGKVNFEIGMKYVPILSEGKNII